MERKDDEWVHLKGLPNIDLSCSINALLQVLAQTPQLPSVLTSIEKQQSSFSNVLLLLINDINKKFKERCKADIESDLKWIRRKLYQREDFSSQDLQNDCHVLLMTLINEMKELRGQEAVELFKIELLDVIECTTCHYVDITSDQFFYSLAIPLYQKEMTVVESINCLFREENMSLECRKCQTQKTTKKMSLKRLPFILVLHLQRIKHNTAGTLEKSNEFIRYERKITIKDAMNKSFNYELYGIIEHLGKMDEGHYIAYVLKCFPGHVQRWYKCSDEHITQIACPTNVKDAYLLFYARI